MNINIGKLRDVNPRLDALLTKYKARANYRKGVKISYRDNKIYLWDEAYAERWIWYELFSKMFRTEYRFAVNFFGGENSIELTYVYQNPKCPYCERSLP